MTATRVGAYTFRKTSKGYVLTGATGAVGTFPTARAANAEAVRLTAAAYLAR